MPEGFDPDGSFRALKDLDLGQDTTENEKVLVSALIDLYRVVNMMGQAIHALQVDFMQLLTALVIEEQAEPEPSAGLRLILPAGTEGSQN